MTASGPLVHRCPFVDEVDNGSVSIVWRCEGATLELHELSHYLGSWADVVISHEELTQQIRSHLDALPGVVVLSVETSWHTAGLSVVAKKELS